MSPHTTSSTQQQPPPGGDADAREGLLGRHSTVASPKPARVRLATLAALTGATALLLTACGSGTPSGVDESEGTAEATAAEDTPTATGELTSVAVGTIAIASSTELRYGVENGIFEKHGLEVELVEGQGGAALLPAVQNGSLNFAIGNPMSVLTAADQGLPMKVVSGYSWSTEEGEDINAVIARADSGIEEFPDLEGQTVTVNALRTLGDLSIMESVALDGGDPSQVNFNEMAFPDMLPQLQQSNVDAVWVPEPFLGMAMADPENVVVGFPNQHVMPAMPLTIAFTSESFAEAHPEVIDSFEAALSEAAAQAWQNEDDLRAMLPGFLNMDEQTAQDIRLAPAHTDLPVEKMQTIYDLMLKYDMAENPMDVSELYVD